MDLGCPVDLAGTYHHLSRPLPHPLNTRLEDVCLHRHVEWNEDQNNLEWSGDQRNLEWNGGQKKLEWNLEWNGDQKLEWNGDLEQRQTSFARSMTSLTETIMTSCTCSSHFSTAPRAAAVEMDWLISTFSPSLLNMAVMSRPSVNCSLGGGRGSNQ